MFVSCLNAHLPTFVFPQFSPQGFLGVHGTAPIGELYREVLAWNKHVPRATRDDCFMVDERGRAGDFSRIDTETVLVALRYNRGPRPQDASR